MISIIIPAHDEARLIGRCLRAVLDGEAVPGGDIIVVANGCSDTTAEVAAALQPHAVSRGWRLTVLELSEGSKPKALNAGDAATQHPARVYLDADVVVSPELMPQLAEVLAEPTPLYASGTMRLAPARSAATRAYGRTYARVPYMTHGVPGAGLFAVNPAGRARWDSFPEIISDDTYVRLLFSPSERRAVPATYDWPLVEGFGNLVRVRRRQNAGVAEIAALWPDMMRNDDKPAMRPGQKLALFLRDPAGFAVYVAVALIVRLFPARDTEWSRGR